MSASVLIQVVTGLYVGYCNTVGTVVIIIIDFLVERVNSQKFSSWVITWI